jgi:hypothetical protein
MAGFTPQAYRAAIRRARPFGPFTTSGAEQSRAAGPVNGLLWLLEEAIRNQFHQSQRRFGNG